MKSSSTRRRAAAPIRSRSGRHRQPVREAHRRVRRRSAPARAAPQAVVHHFRRSANRGRDDGQPGRHRFEDRQRHAFADRAVGVNVTAGQPVARILALSEKSNLPRRRRRSAAARFEAWRSGPSPTMTRSGRPLFLVQRRDGGDQRLEVLDWIQPRDRSDDERVRRNAEPLPARCARFGRGAGPGLDAVVDDAGPIAPGSPRQRDARAARPTPRRPRPARGRGLVFARRRLGDGPASESRPCSVNTIRTPGRHSFASAP